MHSYYTHMHACTHTHKYTHMCLHTYIQHMLTQSNIIWLLIISDVIFVLMYTYPIIHIECSSTRKALYNKPCLSSNRKGWILNSNISMKSQVSNTFMMCLCIIYYLYNAAAINLRIVVRVLCYLYTSFHEQINTCSR